MKRVSIIGLTIISLVLFPSCSKDGSSSSNGNITFTPSPAKGVRYQNIRLQLSEEILSATWSSSNPDIAIYIRNTSSWGEFSCNMEGTVTIRAVGEDKSAETQLEVIPNGTWEAVPLVLSGALDNLSDVQFFDEMAGWACGGLNGHAYYTSDGGQTWQDRLPASLNAEWIHNVFFLNQSTGWLTELSEDIYKTTDSGLTWNLLPSIGSGLINDICFLDENIGVIAMSGSQDGILRTTNGGNTWTQIIAGAFSKIYFLDSEYGWAIESRKNYRTTDGGATWIEGPRIHPSPRSASQLHFEDRNSGWFIKSGKIYTTTDGGITYEEMSLDGFSPSVSGVSGILKLNDSVGWALVGNQYYQTADGFKTAAYQLFNHTTSTQGMGFARSRPYVFTQRGILFNDRY
ncbi:MAG: WD40/YVTN/BNR-like repeat-containing protein [Calditrichia bacterium]